MPEYAIANPQNGNPTPFFHIHRPGCPDLNKPRYGGEGQPGNFFLTEDLRKEIRGRWEEVGGYCEGYKVMPCVEDAAEARKVVKATEDALNVYLLVGTPLRVEHDGTVETFDSMQAGMDFVLKATEEKPKSRYSDYIEHLDGVEIKVTKRAPTDNDRGYINASVDTTEGYTFRVDIYGRERGVFAREGDRGKINWPSIGSVPALDTAECGTLLQWAARIGVRQVEEA